LYAFEQIAKQARITTLYNLRPWPERVDDLRIYFPVIGLRLGLFPYSRFSMAI